MADLAREHRALRMALENLLLALGGGDAGDVVSAAFCAGDVLLDLETQDADTQRAAEIAHNIPIWEPVP